MSEQPWFRYDQADVDELTRKDPRLGEAMALIGPIRRPVIPDLFEALVSSIISQQIAKKAYETVWGRFRDLIGTVTPQAILTAESDAIKACGLSFKKTNWIIGAAQLAAQGELDRLTEMSDEAVVSHLVRFPGIGVWTAQMLLIFSLQRPDVLSFGDLAIRRGICNLYGLTELSKADFEIIRRRLSPHNTIASLYFWELSRGMPTGISETLP